MKAKPASPISTATLRGLGLPGLRHVPRGYLPSIPLSEHLLRLALGRAAGRFPRHLLRRDARSGTTLSLLPGTNPFIPDFLLPIDSERSRSWKGGEHISHGFQRRRRSFLQGLARPGRMRKAAPLGWTVCDISSSHSLIFPGFRTTANPAAILQFDRFRAFDATAPDRFSAVHSHRFHR